jgi:hypothetical protein
MKKLKIRICTFDIAKYGGIVKNVESRVQAFKEMGHDVDIIFLTYNKTIPINAYNKKIAEFESGEFEERQSARSQYGGFTKSEVTGYWRNSYYGWILPPYTNRIPIFAENALELWNDAVGDCDLLFWSFTPTKTKEAKGLDFWPKFFDLPSRIKQVMAVHDGYFDIRNCWIKYLSEKITLLDCVHLSAYSCCQNFDIPRQLNFASRYIPDRLPLKPKKKRQVDFFAAHVFKSMKKMEDLLALTPHLNKGSTMWLAGSGIELYYMTTTDESKFKPKYTTSKKTDPDCDESEIGMSLWERAEKYGMEHFGFMSNEDVYEVQRNAKFSVDPSFSKHYAQYSDTHLNGFTIEAIINGSYPVLRDTRGLVPPACEIDDIIYDELRAIYVPWDVTPKEFAGYLNDALNMSEKKYIEDVKHNFELAKMLFDPNKNMKRVIKNAMNPKRLKRLEVGTNSEKVIKDSEKIMTDFFNCKVPIEWES